MSIPYSGNSSFGGMLFYLRQADMGSRPRVDRKERSTVTGIPYSDNAVIQLAGKEPFSITLPVLIPSDRLTQFLALRKSTGSLNIMGGETVTATLVDVTDITEIPRVGATSLTATFVGV